MSGAASQIRIFVSHSTIDNDFGAQLVRDLRQVLGSQDAVWYDSQGGLLGGQNWWSMIMHEISMRNVFLVILSPEGMDSRWVKAEIDIAWQQAHSGNGAHKLIVPVLYRPCKVRDDLKTLQRISFVAPRSYQEALDQLLLTLQTFLSGSSPLLTSTEEPLPIPAISLTGPLPIWDVPYRRNPFFTGREATLSQLRQNLTTYRNTALTQAQAIRGLGGIGKTQIAVEYAYRYRESYRYVFWLRAAALSDLLSDFFRVAQMLDLPVRNEPDQHRIAAGVKRWLEEHREWLLIFDNADSLAMVAKFLPHCDHGHILLTTRAQATGTFAEPLEVEKMDLQEGILLLLRRAKLLRSNSFEDQAMQKHRSSAETIVRELDGLPLAIDQAGAYIEEKLCSLATYLNLYRTHRKDLLGRRSAMPSDHPDPVVSTWALSFQSVEQVNAASADLLRLCTFLDPDAIPEELLIKGSSRLGEVLEPVAADEFLLNEAIEELLKYSLVRRNADEQLLSIHRLVQAVLKDEMDEATQRLWSERVVRAVQQSLPDVNATMTTNWQLYLPHASACVELIRNYGFLFPEAIFLLTKTALFLRYQALYSEAELLYQQVLTIREQVLGPEHLDTITSLNDLAMLFFAQGKYEQAETLLLRALTMGEQVLGPEHPSTATNLNDLGRLYRTLGKYEQADPLYQQALAIREQALGPEHPDTATNLHSLGRLYLAQGKYVEAEAFLHRALTIREQMLGPEHPDTATSLNNLSEFYFAQGKYAEAEALLHRALAICEQMLGPEHPSTAFSLNDLGRLYFAQGKYAEAEALLQRALTIREQVLGPESLGTAIILNDMAILYQDQGRNELVEPLYRRALAIHEQVLGLEHPDTTMLREVYASFLQKATRAKETVKREVQAQVSRRVSSENEQLNG